MTPSSIRPTPPRTAVRSARRTKLLAASALCGVAAMLAAPALAGTLPGIPSAANITVSSGGSQPFITFPDAITLQIELNAPRTVINWTDLHLSSGDAMNFLFDASSDIVLNKTTSQIQIDNGAVVTGKVGATTAGNVWFYSPQGVIISPGATLTAGGFLFSRGAGLNDVSFVGAADPLANLRAATDALIRMTTISSATSASINSSGDVVLSASSGALNVSTAVGATVDISTTSGSITASEIVATSGAATVAAGGPGATVTQITGETGVTVSSNVNTSVGAATTITSGDILITSNGSASLTLGNSARDLTLSAPQVFLSTVDALRDVFITGTTSAFVTNRIFAGDDIEITADGDVSAGGAYLKSTGFGAADDAHILLRSDAGSVAANNTLLTQGTGAAAGDITVQAATSASVGTADSTRDIRVMGTTASLANGAAARDITLTATSGTATVTTAATAGDDVIINATGDILAGGATLKGTGAGHVGAPGSMGGSYVYVSSTTGAINVGAAATEGTGTAAGDVVLSADTTATLGSGSASRDLTVYGATASLTSGDATRDLFVGATTGDASVITSAIAGDDVEVTTVDGDVAAAAATLRSTGLNAGGDAHVLARSTNGAVAVGSGITQGTGAGAGDVTFDAGGAITGTSAQSTRDVLVTAASDIDLASATAARDITITSNGGQAILRAAVLDGAGAGHDLAITAANDAVLGDPDYTAITAANVFSRTGGNTGAATVRSTGGGDALVHLYESAHIDTLEGAGVDVTIATGAASFDTITALTNNVYVETLDGALTVGAASAATGDVTLFSGGDLTVTGLVHGAGLVDIEGDGLLSLTATGSVTSDDEVVLGGDTVTIAGSVHGDGPVQIGANGLLDGTAATLISSGDDLTILGGAVDLGTLEADGIIGIIASAGDVDVQSAHGGVAVTVAALTANVFVGSAEADDQGVAVQAAGDAVVDLAKVNGANGVIVVQADGDATLRAGEAALGILVEATGTGTATFGADSAALITTANYALTGPASGCGCSPAPDGLQVYSEFGDAVVNAYSVSNPIVLVASGEFEDATVTLQTGDLKIDELAGYNITLDAQAGTLETGAAFSGGGDYTVTAHDFLGDVLTPTLTTGLIRDVTITDTLGGLNLGTLAIHADRKLTIAATNGGAVTGLAQLSAGSGLADGEVNVTASAIALDTVSSDGLVNLDGGLGLVDVATSISVDGNYTLKGAAFSDEALAPLGLKAGLWSITDRTGGFNFTGKTLHYGGALALFVNGVVNGGDITVDTDTITVEVASGHLGALSAGGASIAVDGAVGGVDVDSAEAGSLIRIRALSGGAARLGAATLNGAGANQVTVRAVNGDAVLGAATPGAITAANFVSSAGATTTVEVIAPAGRAGVNLDQITGAALVTVDGMSGAAVKVTNGSLRVVNAASAGGAVTIDGPSGALTVDQLTALLDSRVTGGGDTRLVSAEVDGDLAVTSATGNLRFGDATPGRVIEVGGVLSLSAATDIAQQGDLHAFALGATAGTGVVLLGDNQVQYLDAIDVAAGGFAFHDTLGFELNGAIDAVGQTVDLRSDGAITQASTGVITAQRLTGSSVGGADFGTFNRVVQLGDFSNTGGGLLKLVEGRSLTVTGTVYSAGTVALTSHGGMTIAGTGTVRADGAGDAAVLVSDGVFTNARGADAVQAADPAGRWLIYVEGTGPTLANTFNGLSGKSFYGSAYDYFNQQFATAPNAGNRFVYAYQPTITVTPDSRTVTYNGAIPSLSATVTGLVNGDLFTDAWTGALVISGATSKNVGTYALNAVVGGLTSDLNYAFAAGTPGSLRIDPKALTGVLIANDKTYDGGTAATGAVDLTGVVAGDAVSAAGTYAFADKNAGTGKTVAASGVALSGVDAGNYSLASTATGAAEILKRNLTGALTASNKTYDGTTAATGAIGLTGVLAGDTVSASGTYAFADRNAGAGKTVTASGAVLTGLDAGNYSLTGVSVALADILRRSVTVAADSGFKPFGQVEPTLTYRITVGDLAAGDAFSGALARAVGEIPGDYAITRGTLALSANYDLTFTGAVFTIRPIPSNDQGGSSALKHLNQSPDFTLDWDPEPNLTTEGQGAPSGGGLTVAALR